MAEQSGDKTQDATPHRRQQAREKGQVAFSQDLGSAAVLVVGVLLLKWWGKGIMEAAGNLIERRTVDHSLPAPQVAGRYQPEVHRITLRRIHHRIRGLVFAIQRLMEAR